jgi:UDP-glucose 4-epimerase
MKLLITGISSQLGRLLARQAKDAGHHVMGIDTRPWSDAPRGIDIFNVDLQKRPAEDVFRTRKPDAVVHLATVTYQSAGADERQRINLGGTKTVFALCERHRVKTAVFVGRHTFYGATVDAPLYHVETDPPLAVTTFPELADLVAADLYAASALWRVPQLRTVVLRLCYALGPSKKGTLAGFLSGPRVPMCLGFDPLFQFMHEEDAAAAVLAAVHSEARGAFNVAGPPPMPLSALIKRAGRRAVALPEPILPWVFGRGGFSRLPGGAINHIKFPVVVDDAPFVRATGFAHTFSEREAVSSFREASQP